MQLAEAWAPILFHDISPEFNQKETGFNPVDHLVGLFFDDNFDVRDNGFNIFRLSNDKAKELLQNAPVYYSVIETETHWYINYILYHAVDLNISPHTHDTENILTVVEKDGSHFGRLVMHITNAHGYPMIYGPEEDRELRWRSKIGSSLGLFLLHWIDQHSKEHHKGRPQYLQRKSGVQTIQLFVSSKTHAIYKFSTQAWSEGFGEGVVYVSKSCLTECDAVGWLVHNPTKRISYSLVNWDEVYSKFSKAEEKVFTDQKYSNPKVSNSEFFPIFLMPGNGEIEARAVLFHATSFKTPYRLGDPARMHIFFEGNPSGISSRYLYNPYAPAQEQRGAWSLIADSWGDLINKN